LPLEYPTFRPIHLVWAVLIGLVAGAAGLLVDRLVGWMRVTTRRLDARSVVITATAGGLGLGILYVIGGSEVRFRGIPELVLLVQHTDHAGGALLAAAVKVAATALCLATGYRGGKIFPAAFIGGAVGLTAHLAVSAIPLPVAVGVGMAAAMATALKAPIAAGLCTAVLLVPSLLPLALIGAVVAHTAHLLGDQVAASRASAASVTD
jgi:H+/Cl- antiporter ClcA